MRRGGAIRVLWVLALVLLLAGCDREEGGIARTGPAGLMLWAQPRPLPELAFVDADGRRHTVADFRGKVVLLNVWATWCAPCREEMPALDRLQQQLGGADFQVLALSLDQEGIGVVQRFFEEFRIEHLTPYIDAGEPPGPVPDAPGIPVTLVLDRQGRELGRKLGSAEWDSAEMQAFLRGVIEETAAGGG